MRINELNGDSTVANVTFADGEMRCKFEDGETGVEYSLVVSTQMFYSEGSRESGSVHIRLMELEGRLDVEPKSQRYMAPQNFGAQMQAASEGFMLAVGLKATDWPLFVQIRGDAILVACPIQNERSISIQEIS